MSKPETISLYDFIAKFPNEGSARLYFENKRWSGETVCPHCGSHTVSECKDHKPMPYRCKSCRKHFSVRTGTVLAESRLPLHKWLMAMYMLTTASKGISSIQMAKYLGVTQKTAWFLSQRIRECWLGDEDGDDNDKLEGVVEVDEAHIDGKSKERHAYQCAQREHYSNKQAVVGVLKRGGEVHKNVALGTTVMTDAASVYKHLNHYVNKFAIRHNTREIGTMGFISSTITRAVGKRIKYVDLING